MTTDQLAVLMLMATFASGVRSTWHLRKIHQGETTPRNRITGAYYHTALTITLAAGFFGFLSARRVLGFEAIPGIGFASLLIASAVLLIPLYLDWNVGRIRQEVSQIDRMEAQADRLEVAMTENTRVSQEASEHADAAFHEANTINAKLAAQGREILEERQS